MNNVVKIYRDTIGEVLEEVRDDSPEMIVAFTMKNGRLMVRTSNVPSVTMLVGALELAKFDLLQSNWE